MKKFKLFIAAVVLAGASLTSCSNDDDNGSTTSGNIEGKWNPDKTVFDYSSGSDVTLDYTSHQEGCDMDYIEFASANVLNNVVYYMDANDVCTADFASTATWAKSDNTLTIAGGEYSGTYEIIRLTNSELRVRTNTSSGGVSGTTTVFFTKAN